MLKVTQKIIDDFTFTHSTPYDLQQVRLYTILQIGDKSDADVLLVVYLDNIFDLDRQSFLPVFYKFGDESFAKVVYEKLISYKDYENQLKENFSNVLELLGYFKFKPIKPFLAKIVFSKKPINNYTLSKSATLALLNFDCREHDEQIEQFFNQYQNKGLFPEFFPALISKLPNANDYLVRLFEWGDKHASTDCIAGIILAFSLCGEHGKPYLLKAILSERWEATLSGTGASYFSYQGMLNLRLGFVELLHYIHTHKSENLSYQYEVFLDLLDSRMDDYFNPVESYDYLFLNLFDSEFAYEDNFIVQVFEDENTERIDDLKKLLLAKLQQEMLIQNLN